MVELRAAHLGKDGLRHEMAEVNPSKEGERDRNEGGKAEEHERARRAAAPVRRAFGEPASPDDCEERGPEYSAELRSRCDCGAIPDDGPPRGANGRPGALERVRSGEHRTDDCQAGERALHTRHRPIDDGRGEGCEEGRPAGGARRDALSEAAGVDGRCDAAHRAPDDAADRQRKPRDAPGNREHDGPQQARALLDALAIEVQDVAGRAERPGGGVRDVAVVAAAHAIEQHAENRQRRAGRDTHGDPAPACAVQVRLHKREVRSPRARSGSAPLTMAEAGLKLVKESDER